jgi:hypothetical protein
MQEWDQWRADNRSLEAMRQIALDAMAFEEEDEDAFYNYAEEHDLTVNEVVYYLNAYEYGGDAGVEAIRNPDIIPPDMARRAIKAIAKMLDQHFAGQVPYLERIIEGTKETYCEALLRSSQRWESGNHDLTPWHQYSLGVLIYAYREFEQRVGELAKMPGAKREAVLAALEAFDSGYTFSITELEHMCPTVSRATVRRVLNELREQNEVECLETGRWAQWRKL